MIEQTDLNVHSSQGTKEWGHSQINLCKIYAAANLCIRQNCKPATCMNRHLAVGPSQPV